MSGTRVFRALGRCVAVLLGLILIGVAVWLGFCVTREQLQSWVERLGPWGPLATITLNVLQVLVAPVPGQLVGILNGYLYGPWAGTLYSMLGLLVGTGVAMGLARRFGRPLVERLVETERLVRWDRIAGRRGPTFFFLVFLIPSLPDDLVCFVIGLSHLSLPHMMVLAAIGRLPGVFVTCWFGAHGARFPWWAWLILGGGAVVLAWVFWRFQERIEDVLVNLVQRVLAPCWTI